MAFSAFTNYDYSSGLAALGKGVDSLNKALSEKRRRDALGQIVEEDLNGDNPNYNRAGGRLLALGETGAASRMLELGEATRGRIAGERATAALQSAIGGGSVLPPLAALGANLPARSASIGDPSEVESRFVNTVRGEGLTNPIGLAAVAATGKAESGFSPQNVNRTWSDPSQSGQPGQSGGIMSWREDRLRNLNRFAAGRGEQQPSVETQALFLAKEDPQLIPRLNAAKSPEEANSIMANAWRFAGFDQPGGESARRLDLTRQYLQRFGQQAQADAPAPGAVPAEMPGNGSGFAVPGGPAMSGGTFNAITGDQPLRPAFEAEGIGQPWMGSALQRQPQASQVASAPPVPPRRPFDIGADLPAPGAVPAIGQMPQADQPMPDYSNDQDGGSRAFAASQGGNAPNALAAAFQPAPQGMPAQSAPMARAPAQGPAMADLPAPGAAQAQGFAMPGQPIDNKAIASQPVTRENVLEVRAAKLMEQSKGKVEALRKALMDPNLPPSARQVGMTYLQEALEAGKAPDSVKEFMWARSMGLTTSKSPAEYAREKATDDPAALVERRRSVAASVGMGPNDPRYESFLLTGQLNAKTKPAGEVDQRKEAAARAGLKPGDPRYETYVLTGKTPREDAQPLSATDKKAILEADEGVMAAQTAIQALKDAKALSPRALAGWGAGARASIANNLPDGIVPDAIGSKAQGEATAELENVVTSQALAQLKSIFGAAPTEGERKILLEIQGSIGQPDNVRQKIYDRGIAMAERRLAFNQQRAAEMRGGDYYKAPERRGQPQGGQGAPPAASRPAQQAEPRRAPDGNLYVPDPNRPGKYLMVQP